MTPLTTLPTALAAVPAENATFSKAFESDKAGSSSKAYARRACARALSRASRDTLVYGKCSAGRAPRGGLLGHETAPPSPQRQQHSAPTIERAFVTRSRARARTKRRDGARFKTQHTPSQEGTRGVVSRPQTRAHASTHAGTERKGTTPAPVPLVCVSSGAGSPTGMSAIGTASKNCNLCSRASRNNSKKRRVPTKIGQRSLARTGEAPFPSNTCVSLYVCLPRATTRLPRARARTKRRRRERKKNRKSFYFSVLFHIRCGFFSRVTSLETALAFFRNKKSCVVAERPRVPCGTQYGKCTAYKTRLCFSPLSLSLSLSCPGAALSALSLGQPERRRLCQFWLSLSLGRPTHPREKKDGKHANDRSLGDVYV